MRNQIQPGTMMVNQSPNLQLFALESIPYFGKWGSLGTAGSSGLNDRVRTEGWSLFFIAGELKAIVPAWGGADTLRRGVKRLLAKTQVQHFNCLEVTDIRRKYFLGFPYVSISANPRHIQLGSMIESIEKRAAHEKSEAPLQQNTSSR